MKNILEHTGIAASVIGLIFVAVRLFSVSGGSSETAAAILQSQGTGTVLIASILTFVPVVPMIATNLWLFWIKYSRGRFILIDLPILATLLILVALLTPWLIAIVFVSITAIGEITQHVINKKTFENAFKRVRVQIDKARKKTQQVTKDKEPAQSEASDSDDIRDFMSEQVNSLMSDIPPERRRALTRVVMKESPEPASGPGVKDVEAFRSRWEDRKATADVLEEVLDELTAVMKDLESPAPMRWRGLAQRVSPLKSKLNAVPDPDWERCSDALAAVSSAQERATRYEAISKRLISVTLIGIGATTAFLVAFGAIFLPMWAPLERVEHGSKASVGYVLGSDNKELVILKHRPRGVVRIENVSRRSFCIETNVDTNHRLVRWVVDPTPILGFAYPPRLQYPSCSRQVSDQGEPAPDRSSHSPMPTAPTNPK